jgi:hypothetical protein
MLVVIDTVCTGSCKSNYHTTMTMAAPGTLDTMFILYSLDWAYFSNLVIHALLRLSFIYGFIINKCPVMVSILDF